ncbi:response regulator [Planktothrix mougeotii]|uniref:Response regulatory domain-containing protein n=1 Tax=Planktothrix mougeotii LEGE 06226 TaxID=1828728 RepID=A0ABR9UDR9_9CYAN|nr:hypothetical protein [Planktothrix mougeotii]MBE9144281.1 hypothetical protein [Planktothrix mougeotii LEGE 06226]
MPEQPLKILIIDDHCLLLNGTIGLVSDRFPDAQIFWAQTVQNALTQVREHLPNLVIADLSIPKTLGTEACIENGLGLPSNWSEYLH